MDLQITQYLNQLGQGTILDSISVFISNISF